MTNRRVLGLVERRNGDTVDAAFIDAIPAVNKRVAADGVGTVMFGSDSGLRGMYANTGMDFFGWSWGPGSVNFFDIPDADRVAALVMKLRNESK